jgi:hypothetical protein
MILGGKDNDHKQSDQILLATFDKNSMRLKAFGANLSHNASFPNGNVQWFQLGNVIYVKSGP